MRIGVNTGEVVAGGGEALVTGDAVNVAARLEQAAGTGEVLIGDTTHRLTRDAVLVEAAGGLRVKGKGEPLQAHRLISVSTPAQAIPRRSDLALVGRELELKMLAEAFERAVLERRCHLFTVVGAPEWASRDWWPSWPAARRPRRTSSSASACPTARGSPSGPSPRWSARWPGSVSETTGQRRARPWRLAAEDPDGLLVADWVACAIGLGGSPAAAEELLGASSQDPRAGRAEAGDGARVRGHPLGRADSARPDRAHRRLAPRRAALVVLHRPPDLLEVRLAGAAAR